MGYSTKRLDIQLVNIDMAKPFQEYLIRNKEFLVEWEPKRDDSYFSFDKICTLLQNQCAEMDQGKAKYYFIYLNDNKKLIGSIGITNIVLGPFLSCFLGYKLDHEYINKGLMTEALSVIINICFNEIHLHRIEANVIPRNIQSKKVLGKLGFMNEGISRKYLKINGKWEDHEHYVLLNSELE